MQRFGVEAFARAAVQTGAIRFVLRRKRAAQLSVPAAEDLRYDSYFGAERVAGAINQRVGDIILF